MVLEEGKGSLNSIPQRKVREWFGDQQVALDHWIPDLGVGYTSERGAGVPKTTFTYFHIFPKAGCVVPDQNEFVLQVGLCSHPAIWW